MSPLLFNTPNLLSMFRILSLPVIALLFYLDHPVAVWINIFIFALACISDFFDGMIARMTQQTSVLGKFLDSTSDKILVGGVLLLLVAFGRIEGIWILGALIIFTREILIAGLREFLGMYKISVEISWLGKWKAAVQMAASGFLMAGEYGRAVIGWSVEIGLVLFFAAIVMTVISGWDYLRKGLETIKTLEGQN